MRKYAIVLSVLLLVSFSIPVLAVNNQPVSKPVVTPAKIFECEADPPPTLDGSGSYDLDGNPLTFYWYLGTNFYAKEKTVKVGSDITDHAGTYAFTLKVEDNAGSSDSRDAVLTVASNPIPHIDSLKYTALSPSTIKERNYLIAGDIFQIQAVRSRNNHGENYTWKFDQRIFQMIGSGNIVKFKVVSDSIASNPKIEVYATNACKAESNRLEKDLIMRSSGQNSPPTSLIEPSPNISEGKRFTMSSSSSKTGQGFNEGGDKIISWKWEITTLSGSILLRSSVQNPTFKIENSGAFVAHLWVTDSFGATGYSNLPFWVTETQNDKSIADASATAKVAIHGRNFTLNATKSWDPDGRAEDAIRRYEWLDLTYGEKLCSSAGPTCVVVFNRTGDHKIRLKVFDAGALSEGIVSDIILNVIPASQEERISETSPKQPVSQKTAVPESKETPIDPREILERSADQKTDAFPTSTKPAPGMEAIIAIIAIIVIAERIKN